MNPTQIGNLIKSGLLALGVSSTVVGYVSAEMWVAVGGLVLTVGAAVWQWMTLKTDKLIEAVAAEPVVKEIQVKDHKLALSIPNTKVVKK